MDVTFYFDPACPWTWRASRWLTTTAPERDLSVQWRAFSLSILNEGRAPEQYRDPLAASTKALRLVEALRAAGRSNDVARFYTEMGIRSHDAGTALSEDIVRAAVDGAGVADAAAALDDESWDEAVRKSHTTAVEAAGPDIGSPVMTLAGVERGMHGPILSDVPDKAAALTIWDAVGPLMRTPEFLEIKRGRR